MSLALLFFALSACFPAENDKDVDIDVDADGFNTDDDCNDDDAAIHPDASELCDNADNDCDGEVDEDADDETTWYDDDDGDGFGDDDSSTTTCEAPDDTVETDGDCDDDDDGVHPDADEVCNELDDNCDGEVDNDAVDATLWYDDADHDGYGDPDTEMRVCEPPEDAVVDGTDCDDARPHTWPGADETCDGVDNDCDGEADNDAIDMTTWYADNDGDGVGDAAITTTACEAPDGYVAAAGDCDDNDADFNALLTSDAALEFDFCWKDSSCSDGVWDMEADGSFVSRDTGAIGIWTFQCETGAFDLVYENGTHYVGTSDDLEDFEGTMESYTGNTGTWSGVLVR